MTKRRYTKVMIGWFALERFENNSCMSGEEVLEIMLKFMRFHNFKVELMSRPYSRGWGGG